MKNVDEIKKALEGMVKFADTVDRSVLDAVDVQLLKDTLNLINQYEAQIKSKQETIDMFTDIGKLYSEIKAEAREEFAERLIEKAIDMPIWNGMFKSRMVGTKVIKDLLKEMKVK